MERTVRDNEGVDAGAYGVIVPMINNREEAEQAVMACRYPPDGFRSFGPFEVPCMVKATPLKLMTRLLVAMIETAEGREKAERS